MMYRVFFSYEKMEKFKKLIYRVFLLYKINKNDVQGVFILRKMEKACTGCFYLQKHEKTCTGCFYLQKKEKTCTGCLYFMKNIKMIYRVFFL